MTRMNVDTWMLFGGIGGALVFASLVGWLLSLRTSGGAPLSSGGTAPPSTAQWQKSHPLENGQRPRSRNPPSTRSTAPVGASDVESWMLVSLPQTSSWASGAKSARCQLWTPMTPRIHALEPHTVPISMTAW